MNLAARLFPDAPAGAPAHGPYLRSTFRTQPRHRVSGRLIALFLVGLALLFTKVWERTVANSLSIERDQLAREVRLLENRIRITRDLEEQAAFRSGIDLAGLNLRGFQSPDPSRVVDVDLAGPRARRGSRPGLLARLLDSMRRAVPPFLAERIVGLPAAPVGAEGQR